MIYTDISIKFAPELVELVCNGSKTSTYRLGDKFDFLKAGDRIGVADNSGKNFAEVEIVEKSKTTFKDLSIDNPGHEKYESEEAKTKAFEKHYKRAIDPAEEVIILKFKLV